MASDLMYTMGLAADGFMSVAGKAIATMGHLQLAIDLVSRASGMMTSSFEKAASFEGIEVGIGTITKSLAKTREVMEDIKRLGAATPYELSDLAPAAKALLGAGTATKDVAKQLRVLGDVAAGANTDIQGLVTVFNQVRGRGVLMGDDFQQFAERGIAGLRQEIAKFKGIDVSKVSDALSAGTVSAKDLETIFERMTATGGLFFNAMERQSQTFLGKLSTLSDAWGTLQVGFASPINQALKPVIDDIASLTTMLSPAFEAVGFQVARVVTASREFLLQINEGHSGVDALASSFGTLFSQMAALAKVPFVAIGAALPAIGAGLMAVLQPIGDWLYLKLEQAGHNLIAIMKDGIAQVVGIIPGLTGVKPAVQYMAETSRANANLSGMKAGDVDFATGVTLAKDKMGEALLNFSDVFGASLDAALKSFAMPEKYVPKVPVYNREYLNLPGPGTRASYGNPRINDAVSRPAADAARDQTSIDNAVQRGLQQVLGKLDALLTPLTSLAVV